MPPEERIAEFDQDGTLWVEHPLYTQVVYCLDRVPTLVETKPELKGREPFKTVLTGDREAIAKLSMGELFEIVLETQSGMTVEDFRTDVRQWLATAKHPRWNRLYTDLVYQPMIELLALLRANGFITFIATGGSASFVRDYSGGSTAFRPSGSAERRRRTRSATTRTASPFLTKEAKLLLNNLEAGKIENFWLMLRAPASSRVRQLLPDDQQMLEYVKAGAGARLSGPCCTTTPSANTPTVRRRACRTRGSGRSARRCTTWPSNRAGSSSA